MKDSTAPCAKWAEQLAATHPDDLAPEVRAALRAHVSSCATCEGILKDYYAMDERIHRALQVSIQPELSPQLLNLWKTQGNQRRSNRQLSTSFSLACSIGIVLVAGFLM